MLKKSLFFLISCGLLIAAIFFVRTKTAIASSETTASGNMEFSAIIAARRERLKQEVLKNYQVAKVDKTDPTSAPISLTVSENGIVSGWGKINTFTTEYWGVVSHAENGMTANPIGKQEGSYIIGLTGQKNDNHWTGEAVIYFKSKYLDGGQTTKTSWEANTQTNTNGNNVKGVIKNVYHGESIPFQLNLNEAGEEIAIDETIKQELATKLDKSGIVVVGDSEDRPDWKAEEIMGINNAYVIIDGKRQELTKDTILEPGAQIETKGEDGLAVFQTNTGEYIRLQGNSKVTLLTTEKVKDEEWKKILTQYGKKDPVMLIHAGQMVVKYESGSNKGWWNAAFKKDYDTGSGGSTVGFAGGLNNDPLTGKEIDKQTETKPISLLVENHSEVEYNYSDDNLVQIKVIEGEAIVYKINTTIGKNEQLAKIKTGEQATLDLNQQLVATHLKKASLLKKLWQQILGLLKKN